MSPTPESVTGDHQSTAPGESNSGASAIDPCELISSSDLSDIGEYQQPTRRELGSMRGCDFISVRKDSTGSLPSIVVGVRDNQSVGNVRDVGFGITEATLNGRDAAQVPAHGGCIIALALSDRSRVDVSVTGLDHEQACELVEQVAEIVEPKLPKQR